MNYDRFKKYIVVDEDKRPMSFSGGQFCYADSELSRRPFAVELYTYEEAKKLMYLSDDFRIRNKFSKTKYLLMPVKQ